MANSLLFIILALLIVYSLGAVVNLKLSKRPRVTIQALTNNEHQKLLLLGTEHSLLRHNPKTGREILEFISQIKFNNIFFGSSQFNYSLRSAINFKHTPYLENTSAAAAAETIDVNNQTYSAIITSFVKASQSVLSAVSNILRDLGRSLWEFLTEPFDLIAAVSEPGGNDNYYIPDNQLLESFEKPYYSISCRHAGSHPTGM